MTDWLRRLRRASFNGERFYIESSAVEAGQRVATTGIPNAAWINESFGPAARKFEVEAYLTGDFCHERAEALLKLAEEDHLGTLVLPDGPPMTVRLTKARREFKKDKLGFVAVTLEATADPPKQGAGPSAAVLELNLFSAASLLPAAVGGFAAAAFSVVGQVSTVIDAAIDVAAGAVGDLVGLAAAVGLGPVAAELVDIAIGEATAALGDFAAGPFAFAAALTEAAIVLGDQAGPARLAEAILTAGRPADPPPPFTSIGTAVTIADNAGAGLALTASLRAVALCEALPRRGFADRAEAVEARAVVTAIVDDALARIGGEGLDLAAGLRGLQGLAADLISRLEADIAPVIEVSLPEPQPALVWAWRLYGDPTRADEIARRAGAANPAAMPARFEALSN